MTQGADVRRQRLLRRIRTHQASINEYVRKSLRRRDLIVYIGIASSAMSAALATAPAFGGKSFTERVQNAPIFENGWPAWQLLCLAIFIVNVAALISTGLNKFNDPTGRINTAEACNAELEGLRARVELGNLAVRTAVGEYGGIVSRVLFAPRDLADDIDSQDGKTPRRCPGSAVWKSPFLARPSCLAAPSWL